MALNTSTLRITPEVLSLIAEIDEFKGAWRAIGRIAPERLPDRGRGRLRPARCPQGLCREVRDHPGGPQGRRATAYAGHDQPP